MTQIFYMFKKMSSDALIAVCLVVLLASLGYFVFQRRARISQKCEPCESCESLCAAPRAAQKLSSALEGFDKLKGVCATETGPMRSERRVQIKNAAECAARCAVETGCIGFNFFEENCSLISALDERNSLDRLVGSDRNEKGNCFRKRLPPKTLNGGAFTAVGLGECVHIDSNGESFEPVEQRETEASTLSECARACKNDDSCSSFSFDSLLSRCLINSGDHETRGGSDFHLSASCHKKRFARPSILGYSSTAGECIGRDPDTTRLTTVGRRDAGDERACAKLCNSLKDCVGFTFDKRDDKGCLIINGSENEPARIHGLKGTELQREAFNCYARDDRAPEKEKSDLDRITRILRSKNASVLEDNASGKLLLIEEGGLQHVASTYCDEKDECVNESDPKKGCANYGSGASFFNKETQEMIEKNKLCFRRQHREGNVGAYRGQQAFRRGLDVDRIDSNPTLLGQEYLRKPGRVEGEVLGHHDDFDEAVQKCNSAANCNHISIISPTDIYTYTDGRMMELGSKYGSYLLKRNGFIAPKKGLFPCEPAAEFETAKEAEDFCKGDPICRGFDDENFNTFTCSFLDEPMVLAKKKEFSKIK